MKKIITTLFACALGIGVAAYAQTSGQSGSQSGYPTTGAGSSVGSDQSSGAPSSGTSEDQWGTGSSSQPGVGTSSGSSSTGTGTSDDQQWNQQQQQQPKQPSSSGSIDTPSSTPSSSTPSSSMPSSSGASGSMGMGQDQMGQWPSQVTAVSVTKGKKIELSGSLSNAQSVDNFSLPSTCMTQAEKARFGKDQVLYSFELPANVDATIDVKAADASTKLGAYAYALPQSKFEMPTSGMTTNACKVAIKGQSGGDRVLRIKGAKDAQNVLIGVAALNASSTGTGSSRSFEKKSSEKSSSSSSNIGGSPAPVPNDKGKDIGGTGSSSDKGSFDKGDMNKSDDVYNKTQAQPLKDHDLSGDINHDKGQVSSTQGDLYQNNGFGSPSDIDNNTTQSGSHAGMSTGTGSSVDNGAYNNSDKSLGSSSSSSIDQGNTGTGSSSDIGSQGSQDNAAQPSSSQQSSSHKSTIEKSTQDTSSSSSTVGTGAGSSAGGDFTVTIDLH